MTGIPITTTAVRPDTAHPNTARPDTARPDTAPPDTVHPNTAHPNSVRPDSAHTDTVRTQRPASTALAPDAESQRDGGRAVSEEPLPVTYSLRAGAADSDAYYRDISRLADTVLLSWNRETGTLRERYMAWLRESRYEPLRDEREYTFDILTLGVMWRTYGARVRRTPAAAALVCSALHALHRRFPRLKPSVDPLRGKLASRFLAGNGMPDETLDMPSQRDLEQLLRWMNATGEYREETARLRGLVMFLRFCDPDERGWHLGHVLGISGEFESLAETRLARYTEGVARFHREKLPDYRGREDALLAGRKRIEYHLSMLGAELMNRAFRDEYEKTQTRAVLLPACMRGSAAGGCRARKNDLDLDCTQCTRDCRVGQLTREYAAQGIGTHIIPHSSDFTRWLRDWAAGRDIGVIGVACVLHLITGGLELRALGIPAQCVLLDFCGCSGHWDPAGRQTELNQEQLRASARLHS